MMTSTTDTAPKRRGGRPAKTTVQATVAPPTTDTVPTDDVITVLLTADKKATEHAIRALDLQTARTAQGLLYALQRALNVRLRDLNAAARNGRR
jgi:hypothetical protein